MIWLLDLGGVFWRNWFATKSERDSFELTMGQVVTHKDRGDLIVCCDSRSKRHDWYPEYKANRDEKPVAAIESLRAVESQVADMGVRMSKEWGYEADDLIASYAAQGFLDDVRIISNDKDFWQLVTDSVLLYTKRGEEGAADCVERYGIRPDQMIDWQAMVGDTADNIPGCPSCGPGRARDLLQRFETLEAIKQAAPEELSEVRGVGAKTISAIQEWDPTIAKRLVTLLRDAPVDLYETTESELEWQD